MRGPEGLTGFRDENTRSYNTVSAAAVGRLHNSRGRTPLRPPKTTYNFIIAEIAYTCFFSSSIFSLYYCNILGIFIIIIILYLGAKHVFVYTLCMYNYTGGAALTTNGGFPSTSDRTVCRRLYWWFVRHQYERTRNLRFRGYRLRYKQDDESA